LTFSQRNQQGRPPGFPHTGMVSLVAVMQNGATVETATVGRAGAIGAGAGLGASTTMARAVVQLPGTAAWLSASHFHAAAVQSQAIRDLIVRYNDLLLAQVQQSVACNALHALEAMMPMIASQVLPRGVPSISSNTRSRRATCSSVSFSCFSKAAFSSYD
jgi:hypothetical protein